jgi:hypothetical protein
MDIPFNPFYFIIGLFMGLFYTWLKRPEPEVVYKYPTPDNAGQIVYKDQAGVCYKYRSHKVACPADLSTAVKQPVQT